MEERNVRELTEIELDHVAGGQIFGNSLVAIDNVLNHDNILDNNHLAVAANVLGGLANARA